MNLYRSLFLVSLLLTSFASRSQGLIGEKRMHDSLCVEIGEHILNSFGDALRLSSENGDSVFLYRDSLFGHPIETEDLLTLFYITESEQIINPNDPYDVLIGTVITSIRAVNWKQINSRQEYLFIEVSDSQSFYLSEAVFNPVNGLLKDHIVFLDLSKGHSVSGGTFYQLLQQGIDSIELALYELVTDELAKNYLPPYQHARKRFYFCEQTKYPRIIDPMHPSEPGFHPDSVIITPMSPEFLDHLYFQNSFMSGEISGSLLLTAVSFDCACSHDQWVLVSPGRVLPNPDYPTAAQGWLSMEDAQKNFSEEDLRILHYLNAWNLLH